MDTTSLSPELVIPAVISVIALLILLRIYLKRRVDQSYYGFAWLPAIFEVFTGQRSLLDDDGPRKRTGPDMAFSAGRDAAHRNTRLHQVFIIMQPDQEDALRAFYLDELGLMEMRAPNAHLNQDGFWAISGTRQIYLGTMPDFKVDRGVLPSFSVQNLRDVSERLTDLGYETSWDRSNGYVDVLLVTDPAGNQIGLVTR